MTAIFTRFHETMIKKKTELNFFIGDLTKISVAVIWNQRWNEKRENIKREGIVC